MRAFLASEGFGFREGSVSVLRLLGLFCATPILLLDEATSALDSLSERAVQAALAQWLPSRAGLVVAHRLATVRRATQIAVLDKGECLAIDSHERLLQTSPLYQELSAHQFLETAG